MRAFSLCKVLTVVSLIFFTSLGWGATKSKYKSRQECMQRVIVSCDSEEALKEYYTNAEVPVPNGKAGEFTIKRTGNKKDAAAACKEVERAKICDALDLPDKEDIKDSKEKCNTAYESYREASTKENEACAAFDKTGGKTCKEKSNACRKTLGLTVQPSDGDPAVDDAQTTAVGDFAKLIFNNKFGQTGANTAAGNGACVKSIDRKARAQDKKDKDRERKELQNKIKEQKDDLVKFKEELDKQKNENSEKIAELEAENKKESLNKDKKMREDIAKISKNTVEVGKRLRAYATAITKETQTLATVNFDFQTSMLEMTDEKINQRCKQEFESLKAGIVNSKLSAIPPNASADEKKQYESLAALAAQLKSKGAKGTGELKNLLKAAKQACFERAQTSRNKNKLVNSQAVKTIQDKVDEFKNLIADEKKNLDLDQTNIKNIQSETDKEKTQEEAEKMTKLDNLNSKLLNFVNTTTTKENNAKEEIQKLNLEIQNLYLTQTFEVEDAFSEADEAMTKGESARVKAIASCSCGESSTNYVVCLQLSKDKKEIDGEGFKVIAPDSTAK
jgi:hypothetical protein